MRIAYYPPQMNLYANNRCCVQNKVPCSTPFVRAGKCSDSFVRTQSFTSAKPLTMDWYKNMSDEKRANIRELVNDYIQSYGNEEYFDKMLKYHDLTANCIKDKLNQDYGEGNYVVIPVGRSLSSICKCLEHKIGEDSVKPLPMSTAGRFVDIEKSLSYFEGMEKTDADFDLLKKYLNSIGLSKENVKKSGKHYIFVDYCYTGRSLQGVKNLFEMDKIWGHRDNVHFEDVFNLLPESDPNKMIGGMSSEQFLDNLLLSLQNSSFKRFSVVKDCPRFFYLGGAVIDPKDYTDEQVAFHYKMLENEARKSA